MFIHLNVHSAYSLRGAGPFWIEGEAVTELGEVIVEAKRVRAFRRHGVELEIAGPKAQGLMRGVEGV